MGEAELAALIANAAAGTSVVPVSDEMSHQDAVALEDEFLERMATEGIVLLQDAFKKQNGTLSVPNRRYVVLVVERARYKISLDRNGYQRFSEVEDSTRALNIRCEKVVVTNARIAYMDALPEKEMPRETDVWLRQDGENKAKTTRLGNKVNIQAGTTTTTFVCGDDREAQAWVDAISDIMETASKRENIIVDAHGTTLKEYERRQRNEQACCSESAARMCAGCVCLFVLFGFIIWVIWIIIWV
eukprot:SAG11_NODE_586_length_8341_cov_33.741204_7_plen_244_part_00